MLSITCEGMASDSEDQRVVDVSDESLTRAGGYTGRMSLRERLAERTAPVLSAGRSASCIAPSRPARRN